MSRNGTKQDADYFAMCFLMPEKQFECAFGDILKNTPDTEEAITKLADMFGVERWRAVERLYQIGTLVRPCQPWRASDF